MKLNGADSDTGPITTSSPKDPENFLSKNDSALGLPTHSDIEPIPSSPKDPENFPSKDDSGLEALTHSDIRPIPSSPKDPDNFPSKDDSALESPTHSDIELVPSSPKDSEKVPSKDDSALEAPTLPLLRGRIALADALEEEENMLFRLAYHDQRFDFVMWIRQHREDFEAIVSYHLSLTANETCRLGMEVREWLHGSFNVCVPVYIDNWSKHPKRRVLLRLPLPYKNGGSLYPGNADEKLRTEAATFIWLQDNFPNIPIPHLWGFGSPGGQSVLYEAGKRAFQDKRSISHHPILESIASASHWVLDNGRPCAWKMKGFRQILRRLFLTYTTADSYYSDLLACHDSRIRHQPNSLINKKDGDTQMACLFMMRGLLQHFTSRDLRSGPFVFNLTDYHGSNIFVDRDWHIKYIIDLEWACSLPIEMMAPPLWTITDRGVDQLRGDELQKSEKAHQEFTDIFKEEERSFSPTYGTTTFRANIMERSWKVGSFWYFHALNSPKGCLNPFWQHVHPIFEPRSDDTEPATRSQIDAFSEIASPFWASNARETVTSKLEDLEKYEQELRDLFEKGERDLLAP
ncbi:hypothetical protein SBOR_9108 [Sclerotinia borealis F-4128]|uniref:Aminoglycoside phosphotransferase domain-containing protein n=1 Tax=Sclerotinia borealis (strain F-4128) TaxID=1432307 RepID=W9C129_SCLBF|nr:hypothetical protein SBOR_9108 [Sclerotinia borealis F-4128]